jgi:hypothetical protein
MKPEVILVLNDGTTFTDLKGCQILVLNESGSKKLDDGAEPHELLKEDVHHSFTFA